MTHFRFSITTALTLALAVAAPRAAEAQRGQPRQQQQPQQQDEQTVHISAMANLGLPIGDLANASDIGIGLAIRAEGPLSTPGMSLRGGLSYDRFNGKGPVDSYSYLGASAEFVHRDARSPLYEFAGIGLYGSKTNYPGALSSDHTNLGMQGGLGFDLTHGAGMAQTTFVEFGVTSIFTSGGSSVWFPFRVGLRF